MRTRERWLWAVLGALWLAALGAGARVLWSYQSTPGERAAERRLWPAASRLGGVEAARFGARTSGQVLLYGRDGRLLFSGGITPVRGHVGDSAGQERIVSLVTTGRADAATSRVFGCALGTAPRPEGKGV